MTGAGIVALECLLQAREHPDGMLAGAFADATGTLTADAVRAALASGHPYLRAIGSFSSAVTMRYQALLRDLAEDPAGLHRRFVTAMASGGFFGGDGIHAAIAWHRESVVFGPCFTRTRGERADPP